MHSEIIIKHSQVASSLQAYYESKKEGGLVNLLAPSVIGQSINSLLGTSWLGWAIDILLRVIGVDFTGLVSYISGKVTELAKQAGEALSPKKLWESIKGWISEKIPSGKDILGSITGGFKSIAGSVGGLLGLTDEAKADKANLDDSSLNTFSIEEKMAQFEQDTILQIKQAYYQSAAYQIFKNSSVNDAGFELFKNAYLNSGEYQLKKEAFLQNILFAISGLMFFKKIFFGNDEGKKAEVAKDVGETTKGFLSSTFFFILSVALSTVGFTLISDFIKTQIGTGDQPSNNLFSSISGFFSNDPNDKVQPKKSSQTKYPKNKTFSDMEVERVGGEKDRDSIKATFMQWAKEAYLNIDQSKLEASKDLNYLVDMTYYINSDIPSASFFLLPRSFHSKLQIVDYFMDDVAGHVATTADLRYSKTAPTAAPPAASTKKTPSEVSGAKASESTSTTSGNEPSATATYPDYPLMDDFASRHKILDMIKNPEAKEKFIKMLRKLKPEQQKKVSDYLNSKGLLALGFEMPSEDDVEEQKEYMETKVRELFSKEEADNILAAIATV